MSMTVAVTGASGYLGGHLCEYLSRGGLRTIKLSRQGGERGWELGGAVDLTGVNAVVHCAHDFTDAELNRRGAALLIEQAKQAGVSTFIFVSSIAAFDGCRSIYGKTKCVVEQLVTAAGGICVRPGTIFGGRPGGIMGAMQRLVRKLPVVPLIGSGCAKLFVIHIDDLCRSVQSIMERPQEFRGRIISLAAPEPATLKMILNQSARAAGKRRLFMPVPVMLIAVVLRLAEGCGFRLPLRYDSLVSLMNSNQAVVLEAGLGSCRALSIKTILE